MRGCTIVHTGFARRGPSASVALGFASALALATVGCAQDTTPPTEVGVAAAEAAVRRWVAEGRVPGAVLSVWRDGEPVSTLASGHALLYGYGNGQYGDTGPTDEAALELLDEPVPMTPETVFDLASVTKVMATTTAIALLVDRGDVDLGDPVSSYLPDFTGDGREDVTVEMLLTHRSGLGQWKPTYYHADRGEDAYRYVRDLPLEWAAGTGRHYSDLGFMLLGLVVERVSDTPLDVFVEREAYAPLGLSHTGFRGRAASVAFADAREPFAATSHGNPYEHRMVRDRDFGYRIEGDPDAWNGWRQRTLVGEVNDGNAHHAFGGVAGHAGLFSTAGELQRLLAVWMGGGAVESVRLLSEETVARFLAPTGDGQALGWQLPEYAPAGAFGHTGFTGTFVLGVPDLGVGLILLMNRQHAGVDAETRYPDVSALQRDIVSLLFPEG